VMASIPNTRIAPTPTPAGQTPAAPADPAGFARQLAEIPEELLQLAASILSGGGGGAPAPDGEAEDGDAAAPATADGAETKDVPSEAAQLAALAPMLQPLPAMVPASILADPAAPAPAPQVQPKAAADTGKAPPPAPTLVLPVPTPTPNPGSKIAQVKPEAEATATDADPDNAPAAAAPAAAPEAAARDAIAAARRAIETALRPAGPPLPEGAPRIAQAPARPAATASPVARAAKAGTLAVAMAAPEIEIDAAGAFAAQPAATPAPAQAAAGEPRESAAPSPQRTLDLANDAEWLDRLARDIAETAGNEGTIRFRLHPQTLGHLRVELSQGEHGTAIRLTADTEQARAILADAQPRLVAEARAQGVRISESHVDLSGSDRNASGDPRRQDDARQTPMIRTARGAAADAEAPARPGRTRSDRYA